MGLWSRGASDDKVYMHWYDERMAEGCRPHGCWRGDAAALPTARPNDVDFFKRSSALVCRPQGLCTAKDRRLPASEVPLDFFLLSELRLYVLHAMGLINWVWY